MHIELVVDLRPQSGDMVVDDGRGDQPGIDHLQDVLVLQLFVGIDDSRGRFAPVAQRDVQPLEAVVIAGGAADEHIPAGQIVCRCDRRRAARRHNHLGHPGRDRHGEVGDLAPGVGDGEAGGGDVAAPGLERWQQVVAPDRHEDHVDAEILGFQFLVDELLEGVPCLVGRAHLLALIKEVVGLAEGDEHADAPLGLHLLDVARCRLEGCGNGHIARLRVGEWAVLMRLSLRPDRLSRHHH